MDATQCRMARNGLGWRAQDLADKARVGYATVARFESGATIADASRDKLRLTLEHAGARFSDWRDRVGVTVQRTKSIAERKGELRDAKAGVAKVRKAIRAKKAGAEIE